MTRAHRYVVRTLLVAAALALSAAPAGAQQKVLARRATTPDVSVRLFASVGAVRVIGWDRDSVEVTGVVASGSQVGGFGGSQPAPVSGMKFFIEAPTEKAGREGWLTMRVPRNARVWLKTGSAEVTVSDVTGGLDVNIVGGSITVHGSPRELRAESMDGDVTIDGAPEWMRVKTATGDIRLRGGENIGASTISGAIDAAGGEADHLTLETTTGTIRFSLALARGASVQIETHSGPIDVQLGRTTDVEVDAATVTGAIENAWTRAKPQPGREGRGMTLSTQGGISSGTLVLRSFKGRIALRGS
ncbi:MAG TPA: DUF4097 family beta strand repeat-containing protein [Gemmatimonadaceae bacterium]|nr:DUF4097 family beta strand repeat-containing protein [Gemmatimonadaceae bacterium]